MFQKKSTRPDKHMLFITNAIVFVMFTVIYWIMDTMRPGIHFGDSFDPVYFSVITHTTIGFGDISPKTTVARYITSLHAVLTLVVTLYYI